jgi:hypothetical protein
VPIVNHRFGVVKRTEAGDRPLLFATLAEAPLEDLGRLREEINGYAEALKPTG